MFKTIRLRNFRCFSDTEFDLTGPRDAPLKLAVIYGANASGKTSIIRSLRFLKDSAMTFRSMRTSQDLLADPGGGIEGMIAEAWRRRRIVLRNLVAESFMVGAEGPMELSYRFSINGRDAIYTVGFSDPDTISREHLRYISVNGRAADIFSASREGGKSECVLSHDAFPPSSMLKMELAERYRAFKDKHTLLSMIVDAVGEYSRDYVAETSPRVLEIVDYIESLNTGTSGLGGDPVRRIESSLTCGTINSGEIKELNAYRDAIDRFFTRIDRDVESVEYRLTESSSHQTSYALHFNRFVSGKVRDVPFDQESTGVRKLLDLFPMLLGCTDGRVSFMDEIDSGIHDVLMHDMLLQVLPDLEGQLIVTTHNTSLLRDLDPRNVFVIDIDMDGDRTVTSVRRKVSTRPTNNNQIRYGRGELGGIPVIASIGMRGIVDHLREDLG